MSDSLFRRRPPDDMDVNRPAVGITPAPRPETVLSKELAAEQSINEKWSSLGGAPGNRKIPGLDGLVAIGEGYFCEYDLGRIYLSNLTATPYHVYGAIGDRYTELGGPSSWLGWPTSDEQPFTEDGRVSTFQNGAIYWWLDTGAIELGNVAVRYKGLYCLEETDDQMWSLSTADEPYVIIAVVPSITAQTSTLRTRIYENVDAGDSREDNIELYRGLPYGLSLTAVAMEHDLVDPDMYLELIKQGADKAAEGVAYALGEVPLFGPVLAVVSEPVLKALAPVVAEEFNDLIDGKDDHIGTVKFQVSAKDMVRSTRTAQKDLKGISWHLDSPEIRGDGGRYKIYVDVIAV